jgi:hypothetical protein
MRSGLLLGFLLASACTHERKPDPAVVASRCAQGIDSAVHEESDRRRMTQRIVVSCRDIFRAPGCRQAFEQLSVGDPAGWVDACAISSCPSLTPQPALCTGAVKADARQVARLEFMHALLVRDWGEAGAERIARELTEVTARYRKAAERGVLPWDDTSSPPAPRRANFVVRITHEANRDRVAFVAPSGLVTREVVLDPPNAAPIIDAARAVAVEGATYRLEAADDVSYAGLVTVVDALSKSGFTAVAEP